MGDLLVVEDDAAIGGVLTFSLQRQGHEVVLAASGAEALAAADIRAFDLALIDRGLPDMDGLDVCRGLRAKQSRCVLVMLTGRGEEIDVVLGLEAGADDYLTKPFRLAELMARVSAHLRRGRGGVVDDSRSEERRTEAGFADQLLTVGALGVDLGAREGAAGRRGNRPAGQGVRIARPVGPGAGRCRQPGVAVSRATLMTEVWDSNWYGSTKTLDVHIAALRKKLAAAAALTGANAPEIVTLRAHGFRLETPSDPVP